MARSILVFAVVFLGVMCLISVGPAQQDQPPPSIQATRHGWAVAPPVPAPPAAAAYGALASYSHDEVQAFKQEFITLAQRSAERMNGPELKQGIAEMRRQFIISELQLLADEPQVRFHGMRAEIAAVVLKSSSQTELESVIRSLAKELEAKAAATDTPENAPEPRKAVPVYRSP
jgi:ribosomal protein S10